MHDEVALSPEFYDQYPDFADPAWYYFDQDLLDEATYFVQEINSDNDTCLSDSILFRTEPTL